MSLLSPTVNYGTGPMVSPTRNLQKTLGSIGTQFSDYRKEQSAKEEIVRKEQLTRDAMAQRTELANLPFERQAEERAKQSAVMANVPKNIMNEQIAQNLGSEYNKLVQSGDQDKIKQFQDALSVGSGRIEEGTYKGPTTDGERDAEQIQSNFADLIASDSVVNAQEYSNRVRESAIQQGLGIDVAEKMAKSAYTANLPVGSEPNNMAKEKFKLQQKIIDTKYDPMLATISKYAGTSGKGKGSGGIGTYTGSDDLNDIYSYANKNLDGWAPTLGMDAGDMKEKIDTLAVKYREKKGSLKGFGKVVTAAMERGSYDSWLSGSRVNKTEFEDAYATIVSQGDDYFSSKNKKLRMDEALSQVKAVTDAKNLAQTNLLNSLGSGRVNQKSEKQRSDAVVKAMLGVNNKEKKEYEKKVDTKEPKEKYGGKNSLIGSAMAKPKNDDSLVKSVFASQDSQEKFGIEFANLKPSEQNKVEKILSSDRSKKFIDALYSKETKNVNNDSISENTDELTRLNIGKKFIDSLKSFESPDIDTDTLFSLRKQGESADAVAKLFPGYTTPIPQNDGFGVVEMVKQFGRDLVEPGHFATRVKKIEVEQGADAAAMEIASVASNALSFIPAGASLVAAGKLTAWGTKAFKALLKEGFQRNAARRMIESGKLKLLTQPARTFGTVVDGKVMKVPPSVMQVPKGGFMKTNQKYYPGQPAMKP